MKLIDSAPPLHMTCYREGNRYSFEWNWKREFAK